MESYNKAQLIRAYIERYNSFNVESMLALFADDILFEKELNGEINAHTKGKVEFATLAEKSSIIFRSREQRVI